jgi:hypothetical protein
MTGFQPARSSSIVPAMALASPNLLLQNGLCRVPTGRLHLVGTVSPVNRGHRAAGWVLLVRDEFPADGITVGGKLIDPHVDGIGR